MTVESHLRIELRLIGHPAAEPGSEPVPPRGIGLVEPLRDGHHRLRAGDADRHLGDEQAQAQAEAEEKKAGKEAAARVHETAGW